jgi:signal transduction histidine kinase
VYKRQSLLLEEIPGPLTDNQRELVDAMREDEERLKNLVSDLLDLSRIESGKMDMNIIPNEIEKIIEQSVRAFSNEAEDKNISLTYLVDDNLPYVKADINKISRVLINLIGNAMRYTPKDGSGKIKVEAKKDDNTVLISVTDNGSGIPQEYRSKIFQKFVQVKDEQGNSTGGTGLGLAISREIIDAHGGKIWAESKLGKGSTFYFTLPVDR